MHDLVTTIARIFFWLSAGAIIYAYVGYIAILVLLSAIRRRQAPAPEYEPSITVVICAYNESAHLGAKLEQTLDLDYPDDRLEIIVVSDASQDGTDEIVRSLQHPRVRLVRMPQRGGKTMAQNHAAGLARGEVLVFSDATSVYHRQALRYLAAHYTDPHVGAVSGRYRYFDPCGTSPTGLGSIAFWNYENIIKSLQSRIATLTGCSGCIYSVRRSAYQPLPPQACSDLVEPLAILEQGYRIAFEPRALAFEESTQQTSEEFTMRVRVAARGISGIWNHRSLLDPLRHPYIAFQLLSHKVARWAVPLHLAVVLATSLVLAGQTFFRAALLAQAVFYLLAGVALWVPIHRRWRLLAFPLYFCTLNAAVIVSAYKLAKGNRFATWQTVRN